MFCPNKQKNEQNQTETKEFARKPKLILFQSNTWPQQRWLLGPACFWQQYEAHWGMGRAREGKSRFFVVEKISLSQMIQNCRIKREGSPAVSLQFHIVLLSNCYAKYQSNSYFGRVPCLVPSAPPPSF